ncbi:uncharacterized protein CTRU02_214214 [Colletotrichum truncatum]|uniref:Uncharacterized protein n=1 Tax=Colletotrichum truncatum TaxID=5467 RepID=A0ACC3YHW0_COLTU|nr:uncharacterized protein CTRU02_11293 [Colletotrichum truncatum]KAF6786035.1 hypothetical protein CTRU02_11293 [Colletotrichum truncatum]
MSDDVVLYVAWDMLQALAYLHGRGVVHGDIRPQNFLSYPRFPSSSRNHSYSYKLMGHGLVPKVIRDWSFPGSAYTAPELRGRKYKPTFASDVWMLGLALWELHAYGLSHKVPRSSKPVAEMSAAEFVGLEKRVKGCHGYNHGILCKLLREMLVRNPRGRATAMGALTSLAEFRFRSNEGGTLEVDLQRVEEAIGHARKEMWQRSVLGRAAERVKRLVGRLLVFMIALWVRVLGCR